MATIQTLLTLKEAEGTRLASPLPANPIASFAAADINTLLAGTNPQPEGIRLHFQKTTDNATVGLIAVSLGLILVDNPSGGTSVSNMEMTSSTKKYVQRGSQGSGEHTASEYRALFPSLNDKFSGNNTCVFFSRFDLKNILNQAGVTGIAFFPASIQRSFTPDAPEQFDTLIAAGINDAGQPQGSLKIRSELPCPPHCGDDYPPKDRPA